MRIWSEDSPEADAERERLCDARERRETLRLLSEAAAEDREALHNLDAGGPLIDSERRSGAFDRIKRIARGECPECGKPDTRFHGCPLSRMPGEGMNA